MIQVTLLPLSSPEVVRLRKWFHADEANLMLQVVNAELTTLEIEMAQDISQSTEFPIHENYANDKFRKIKALKNFLDTFNRLAKSRELANIRLEIKYE